MMTSIERIVGASSSMCSLTARSMASVMIGATLRTTTIAPIEARSSASMEEASMKVKRRGMVVAHRSTSRTEPKCSELDVVTWGATVHGEADVRHARAARPTLVRRKYSAWGPGASCPAPQEAGTPSP